jgi:hypothetical protein
MDLHTVAALLIGTGDFLSAKRYQCRGRKAKGFLDFGNVTAFTPTLTRVRSSWLYRGVRRVDKTVITKASISTRSVRRVGRHPPPALRWRRCHTGTATQVALVAQAADRLRSLRRIWRPRIWCDILVSGKRVRVDQRHMATSPKARTSGST